MQTKNFQMLFIATNLLFEQQTNKKPINENEKRSNVVDCYLSANLQVHRALNHCSLQRPIGKQKKTITIIEF